LKVMMPRENIIDEERMKLVLKDKFKEDPVQLTKT